MSDSRVQQFVPFKKVGTSITPKVAGDALDATIIGSTTPAAGAFTTGNFSGLLTGKTGRGATLTVAANDSSALSKAQADYVCDGTDDEVEIQAAIDALPASGGKVQLMEGTFEISGIIFLCQNLTFEGMGYSTVLNFSSSGSIHIYQSYVMVGNFRMTGVTSSGCVCVRNGGNNCYLHDMVADTISGCWSEFRIIIADYTLDNITFNRCIVKDSTGMGFANSGTGTCVVTNLTYNDCQSINCGRYDQGPTNFGGGFIIGQGVNVQYLTMDNCLAQGCWEWGFEIEAVNTITYANIRNCKAIDIGIHKPTPIYGHGFYFNGTAINITNCFAINCELKGILLKTTTHCNISKSNVYNCNGSAGNGDYGICIWGGVGSIIDSCFVDGNGGYGIYMTSVTDGRVVNNCSINGDYIGIYIYSNTRVIVTGNESSGATKGINLWMNTFAILKNNWMHDNDENLWLRDNPTDVIAYEKHIDLFMDVLAVSANYIRSNEDLSEAIPNTFTIDAQPDVPRTLSGHFDAHAQITAYTIVITGVDAKGNTVTETKTAADGWDWETSNAFATITSIIMTVRTGTGAGDTMDIGITDVLGLSNTIYATSDVFKIKKNNGNATVATAQVNTTYDTYDMSVITLGAGDDFTIWYKSNLNIIS